MSNAGATVGEATTEDAVAACLDIRRQVFVDEQGVPPEIEVDGDDPKCWHYLALLDEQPVGAARMKPIDGAMKLQRIAVLPQARGGGHGVALVLRMIADARALDPGLEVVLASQKSAIAFYEKLGFSAEGAEFMDAGIPHQNMRYAG